jgi:acetyl-CoA C-acetyltransferase
MQASELSESDVVIVSAARTPMGGLSGSLATVTASELGAIAIKAALERCSVNPEDIGEVLMGNVLSAGVGQAPARQAALGAGLQVHTPCTTVSKVCGSGLKAVMLGFDQIKAGSLDLAVVGGMESMTNAPYFLAKARAGYRAGHGEIKDHMFYDGLEDAYTGRAMGSFAQDVASARSVSREAMDAYALESLRRAQTAIADGKFKSEIAPVTVSHRGVDSLIDTDEQPGNAKPEKIPNLKPAFAKDGTITAANSSSISDGAAALVVSSVAKARALGLPIMAKIVGHSTHAQQPSEFCLAPVSSVSKLLSKVGWQASDVDLFEINEAFGMVTMIAMQDLGLDHGKVNVHGGACALGHPIGASGARILVTLLYALQQRGGTRGLASLCIGGGEATSLAVELVSG